MTLRLGVAALGSGATQEVTFAPWTYGLLEHRAPAPYGAPTLLTLILVSASNCGSRWISRDHMAGETHFELVAPSVK